MKVLITGSQGFIGRNLTLHLTERGEHEVLPYDVDSPTGELERLISQADVICHLAGVNRPQNTGEFVSGNVDLTREICVVAQKSGRRIPVLFTSSTQAELDNPYGASKREAEEVLLKYAKDTGSAVYIFRLPNVFGKWCRPNYNSAVATFCHNIARGLPIQINDASHLLTLVYIDDVVTAFEKHIKDGGNGSSCTVNPTYSITVSELAGQIQAFHAGRRSLKIEEVGTGFQRALYSTYISYLSPEDFTYTTSKHEDPRGAFVEMLKTKNSGQFSFFTARPGITRGGHYHHTKTEKFLVIQGRARFRFQHIISRESHDLLVSGDNPQIVDTVPGWAHDITNVGDDDMIVMLWANEVFDPGRPDTYSWSF